MVELKQHNLLEPNDHFGQFDVIFCRNVLIYFDVPTKAKVLAALAPRLGPDGAFVLGAAETVIGITTTIVPDKEHRGLYRDGRSGKAQPPITLRPSMNRGASSRAARSLRARCEHSRSS